MTIDDENSVYVGGLPYSATEDSLRRVFDLYGAIVAVKIINDQTTRGKCYGFVTFTNPRSAVDAINDMDGRKIDGRVVRVNEVTTRGGRSNFRERFRHGNWDRGRERERHHEHERSRYRDQDSDRSRERDQSGDNHTDHERAYVHAHDHDRSKEHHSDRDQYRDRDLEDNGQERSMEHDQGLERKRKLNGDQDGGTDETNSYHRSIDDDRDQQSRRLNGSIVNDRRNREHFSYSSNDYNGQVKAKLEGCIQRREGLQNEITQMQEKLDEKQQLVSDLQKKSKKLEDQLTTAKKLSSQRKIQLTKLHKSFLQVKEYTERLKSSEQELQSLVDLVVEEGDTGDDLVGTRDEVLANGYA